MPDVATGGALARRHASHRLKGACASLGDLRLQALFAIIEVAPDQIDADTLARIATARRETLYRLAYIAKAMERNRILTGIAHRTHRLIG
jgi:HPt (histidine-containing phosphotransfer) domain-containing protein